MITKTKSILIKSSPERVFAYMDNLGNTGMHMSENSMAMMGSRLSLQQLSPNAAGLGSTFKWSGKVMGFPLKFTVTVTKWTKDQEKIWETSGEAKMIILSWYRMHLVLTPIEQGTMAELSIDYELPRSLFFKIIAFFLAPLYANWCLNNMLGDSKAALESTPVHPIEQIV